MTYICGILIPMYLINRAAPHCLARLLGQAARRRRHGRGVAATMAKTGEKLYGALLGVRGAGTPYAGAGQVSVDVEPHPGWGGALRWKFAAV